MKINSRKPIMKLASSLILLATLLTGCATNGSPPSTQPTTTSEPTHTPTDLQDPIEVEVSFPDGAPPLNQTAELRCTVITHGIPARDMSLKVDLPDVLQLVEGELSWFGDVPAGSKVVVIKAVVKALMVGNGTVDVRGYIDPDKHLGYGGNTWYPVYVSIAEDSSEWRTNPPYDAPTGTGPREERPTDLPPPPTTSPEPPASATQRAPSSPLQVDLSISGLPVLSVPVTVTCNVSSPYDAQNTIAQIKVPQGAALVQGNLEWQGDLKANNPVSFSAEMYVVSKSGTQLARMCPAFLRAVLVCRKPEFGLVFPPS